MAPPLTNKTTIERLMSFNRKTRRSMGIKLPPSSKPYIKKFETFESYTKRTEPVQKEKWVPTPDYDPNAPAAELEPVVDEAPKESTV